MMVRSGCIALAMVAAWSASAAAEPSGTIVFSRKGVLHERAAAGPDGRELGAVFGDGLPLDWLAVAPGGARLVAGSQQRYRQAAVPAPGGALAPTPLLCWSSPRPSADGKAIVCGSGSGAALVAEPDTHRRWLVRGDGARAGWLPRARAAVVITGDLIVAQPATGAARTVAPHAPTGTLSVSPTGERAVGVYAGEGDDDRALYTFRLDGAAVKRKLMREAEPIAWSADGAWLLVQQEREACLVRTVGGEYKCWSRYQAAAIAPAGDYALLIKPRDDAGFDLYRAELEGASAKRPVLLETDIDGPAAWY